MSNYIRVFDPNRYYFMTIITGCRRKILIQNVDILREAFKKSKNIYNYQLFAIVILPEHIHMLIKPKVVKEYPEIISCVKREFTNNLDEMIKIDIKKTLSQSKIKKRESGVWHRRYYEHTIRNEDDLFFHLNYIHFNPVKHKLVKKVKDWRYSSFFKFVNMKWYDLEWGDFDHEIDLE